MIPSGLARAYACACRANRQAHCECWNHNMNGTKDPDAEEKTMNSQDRVSIQRRRVLKAGGAGMLAPAVGSAAARESAQDAARHPFGAGDALVLSGCLRGADGQPLASHAFELLGAGGLLARATSDGVGRFVLGTRIPARAGNLSVHVAGAAPQALKFGRNGRHDSHLDRDVDGTWRAAVSVTFA